MLKWIHKKEKADYSSIEVFQLENLINNQIPFLFFNLSPHFLVKDYGNFVSSVLKLSQAVTEQDVKKKLENTDKSKPIILICEKGSQSCSLAQHLQKKGFINTFFIKDGIMSLIEEKK
ncbi:MAG: rhodanese-like domain-containing protein [Bdellovibrionales bacterium]|nr:rhodanese-like domain-containing protein [Bdellovibrionales bacterium]